MAPPNRKLFSSIHATLYDALNRSSTRALTRAGPWLTADAITSGRLTLVLPTLALWSRGYEYAPASLILLNALLDYADGAMARWEKSDEARRRVLEEARGSFTTRDATPSVRRAGLDKAWGAYFDALADKAFAIPIWIAAGFANPVAWLQLALTGHVLLELVSAGVRTKAFIEDPGASSKVVTADAVGKTKQMVSMLGTSFLLVGDLKLAGGVLMWISLPLAYASVRNKLKSAAPSVLVQLSTLDAAEIQYLARCKQLAGSGLVVACHGPDASRLGQSLIELGPLVASVVVSPELSAEFCERHQLKHILVRDDAEKDALIPPLRAMAKVVARTGGSD